MRPLRKLVDVPAQVVGVDGWKVPVASDDHIERYGFLAQKGSSRRHYHRRSMTRARTPELSKAERTTRRVIGVAILVVGGFFSYSWAFTDFQHRVQYQWESDEAGERIPLTHVTCPSPWSVVSEDARPSGAVVGEICVRPARGMLMQAALFALFTLTVGVWTLMRSGRPRRSMPELPPSVRNLLKR